MNQFNQETNIIHLREISYDIQLENSSQTMRLLLSNSDNKLKVNVSNPQKLLENEYCCYFTVEELKQKGKIFLIFEGISGVLEGLKEVFENKMPVIRKKEDAVEVCISPILTAMGEVNLLIPKKNRSQNELVNQLCNIVKEEKEKNESLEKRVKFLEEKIQQIESAIAPLILREQLYLSLNDCGLLGGIIKIKEDCKLIFDWLGREKKYKFELLYKGTRDGDTIEIFHKKCDNKGATITIIELTDSQILGGYTSKSWLINSGNIPDPKAFLFNLTAKEKYPVENNSGICSGYICDFGTKDCYELSVNNNFLDKGGVCGGGKGYNFRDYKLTGGKSSYKIRELEVYKVSEVN